MAAFFILAVAPHREVRVMIKSTHPGFSDFIMNDNYESSLYERGTDIEKVVPFSSDVSNQTFPLRYFSPKSFIL